MNPDLIDLVIKALEDFMDDHGDVVASMPDEAVEHLTKAFLAVAAEAFRTGAKSVSN